MVERLSALRVPHREIARSWFSPSITPVTLRKHFREELDHGTDKIVSELKDLALKAARKGSLRAIFELLDRIDPSFAKPQRSLFGDGTMPVVPAGTTITIHGGLPSRLNGHGEPPPASNGQDQEPDALDADG